MTSRARTARATWSPIVLAGSVAWAVTACGHSSRATAPDVRAAGARAVNPAASPSCDYDVTVVRATALVDVSVHCTGFSLSGFGADPSVSRFTTDVVDARGRALARARAGSRWTFPPSTDVSIHYRVDLDRAAHELDDFDVALGMGHTLLAPGSSYLLAPEPARAGVAVTVHVHPLPGASFATGLMTRARAFVLDAHELRTSTYGVFGTFDSDVVRLRGRASTATSEVEVIALDGSFALSRSERVAWVQQAARAVGDFYGGFPVPRVLVILVPVPGPRRVVFGKVLPAGGSSVVVLVGSDATRATLDDDWVLVHELFHLGFPSFIGRGTWLDEGLATYAEPLIRARAGLLTEEQAWSEVTRDMDRGVRLCETTGLEHPEGDFRAIYWGGAVVALLSDAEARRVTNGARGLENALREVLAEGGDATHVWPLSRAIDVIDGAVGSPVLAPLARAYMDGGNAVPLDAVLRDLGVERLTGGGVRLHEDAPLSAARHAITYGAERQVQ